MKQTPEANEQLAFLEYCRLKGIAVAATPNETPAGHFEDDGEGGKQWKRHWKTAKAAKVKGASEGFPDLTIVCPCGDGKARMMYVEMTAPNEKPKRFADAHPYKKPAIFYKMQDEILDEDNWQKNDGTTKKTVFGVKRAQVQWIRALNRATEVGAFVCYSADEAIGLVDGFAAQRNFS